jgi:hypothetical protein
MADIKPTPKRRRQQATFVAVGAGLGAAVGVIIGGGPGIGIGVAIGAGFGVALDALVSRRSSPTP